MKIVDAVILAAALCASAQGRRRRNRDRLSKRDALRKYLQKLNEESDSRYDKLFAIAIKTKVKQEGLPDAVYKQIVKNLEDEKMRGMLNDCSDGECLIPLHFRGIWGYGCWCNFGYDLLKGSSKPVDEFDGICKNLQMCLRCARIDARENDYKCNPVELDYNATFNWVPDQQSMEADCSSMNPGNSCATHVCSCEMNLISQIMDLIWNSVTFNPDHLHSSGWDHEANCPPTATGDGKLKTCCGFYPKRQPYGGDNECCAESEQVYNPYMYECCNSYGVFPVGTACP